MSKFTVVNRAPIMTAWSFVVAERMGFQREEALSIGEYDDKVIPHKAKPKHTYPYTVELLPQEIHLHLILSSCSHSLHGNECNFQGCVSRDIRRG